jgi:hypothetical protein
MSASPPKADISKMHWDVSFWSEAGIASCPMISMARARLALSMPSARSDSRKPVDSFLSLGSYG